MDQDEPASRSLHELISLADRVAVVTGAAHGVGTAIVARLVEAGARVVLADLDTGGAEAAAEALPAGSAAHHGVDVTSSASVADLADFAVDSFGRLDIWVNNAGIYPRAGVLTMTDEQWSQVLDVNLTGAFYGARAAARVMVEQKNGGVIVNIASASAFRAGIDLAHYTASKSGVVGLTKALAVELGPRGVRVLGIGPILVPTANALSLLGQQGQCDAVAATTARVPLRRVPQSDDIARVVVFAASGLASMMTGSTLLVDAGQLSGG